MEEPYSHLVGDEQASTADMAGGSSLAGEQLPLNPGEVGVPKRKRSFGTVGSLKPRSLRVNDAAAIYGVSRSTLYKLMKPGGPLRSVKLGGRRLIPVDALEALIAGGAV
jgi:excisionase family DNA binding protein